MVFLSKILPDSKLFQNDPDVGRNALADAGRLITSGLHHQHARHAMARKRERGGTARGPSAKDDNVEIVG